MNEIQNEKKIFELEKRLDAMNDIIFKVHEEMINLIDKLSKINFPLEKERKD